MELYFPTELGEQLAFCAAAFTALVGLLMMFAPGYAYRFYGLQVREGRQGAYAESRSVGGFYVGLGVSAILFAQMWIYMALGIAFAVAAFGRILSLMSDRGGGAMVNLLLLVVQAALAAALLVYAFGFI
jgi:hypothetical protein